MLKGQKTLGRYLLIVILILPLLGAVFAAATVLAAATKVEIFSWWTGGGEEEGLQAICKVFRRNYPDIEINNATVAGGAGTNAKAVLQTRMVAGNPPDSFQVHGGAELIDTYVKTGMMEPITKLVDAWGVRDRFNPQILELCSYKGEIYSIPVNVHRGNVIWYNKKLLAQYHLAPPQTVYELIDACRKLSQAGITPLALGDKNKWEGTHLFENILVAVMGPAKYNGLWKGQTSFNDPGLHQALVVFKTLVGFANKDHPVLTWQDATKMIYEGKAAFNIMGDWAEGYFKTLGWTPGKEFGWIPITGNRGYFMIITDTFGLPRNAPHQRGAIAWLKMVASVEGQDTFNPIKGSIPSRLDADRGLYDPYLRSSMADFSKLTLTPSIVHGSAASQGFSLTLNDIVNQLIEDGNVDQALKAIKKAAADYLE